MNRWAVHAIAAGGLCAFPCAHALYLFARSRHADRSFNLPGGLAIVLLLFVAFYLLVSTLAVAALGSSTIRVVVIDCVLFAAVVGLASRFDLNRDYFKDFKSNFRRSDPVRPAMPSSSHLRVLLDSPASFDPVVSALRERGIALLGKLDTDALLCFGLPQQVEGIPGVRSATPFPPAEKIETDLVHGTYKPWATLPGARVQLEATFWSDVPIARADELVRATGAEVLSSTELVRNVRFAIQVTSAPSAARQLSERDEVARMAQPAGPRGINPPLPSPPK